MRRRIGTALAAGQLGCRRRIGSWRVVKGKDESIADARHGFDEARRLGGITERFPEAGNRVVQPMVEVEVGGRGPQPLAQFLAGDDLARALEERDQYLEGLLLQPNP